MIKTIDHLLEKAVNRTKPGSFLNKMAYYALQPLDITLDSNKRKKSYELSVQRANAKSFDEAYQLALENGYENIRSVNVFGVKMSFRDAAIIKDGLTILQFGWDYPSSEFYKKVDEYRLGNQIFLKVTYPGKEPVDMTLNGYRKAESQRVRDTLDREFEFLRKYVLN